MIGRLIKTLIYALPLIVSVVWYASNSAEAGWFMTIIHWLIIFIGADIYAFGRGK